MQIKHYTAKISDQNFTNNCATQQTYKMCSKSTKTEARFTKKEINNEWNFMLFCQKIVPLTFNMLIPMSFQLVQAPL